MANVTVYSSPTCLHCQKAKRFLEDNKIIFEDYHIFHQQETAEEMQGECAALSVPVINVGGELITGFDERQLRKILNIQVMEKNEMV